MLADELGELGLPVYLYGVLAGGRTRAELRRGGRQALIRRTAPDFGPAALHPTAGAVLVAARPPLVAFNLELAPPATLADAKRIAARDPRGRPEGLPGVRALGLELTRRRRPGLHERRGPPTRVPLADVLAAVARHAPVAGAELVAPAPRPRSTAARPASRSATGARWRTSIVLLSEQRWPRRSASAAPSTAATPPGWSSRAGAPAAARAAERSRSDRDA